MSRLMLFVAVLLAGATAQAQAGSSAIVMNSFAIPKLVVDSDNGLFVNLTKEAAKRAGVDVTIAINPTKRSIEEFEQGDIDSLMPATAEMLTKPYAGSSPINIKRNLIFTKGPEPGPSNIAGLAGKRVGLTLGYTYGRAITESKDFTIELSPSDDANLKKLSAGRIDAFIAEEKTGIAALKASGLTDIVYDAASPVTRQESIIAFHDTPAGHDLATRFTAALDAMKADGTYARIMEQGK